MSVEPDVNQHWRRLPATTQYILLCTYVGICMFSSTTREFKGCALALSDVRWLSEEKILRCQRAMRTLNNAGAVELTIYLVKMPVLRRRDRFCQNSSRARRFRSDFLNIWRCSFAFNASHLQSPSLLHRGTQRLFGYKSADRTRIFTWGCDLQSLGWRPRSRGPVRKC